MGEPQQPEVHHEDQTQEEAHAEDVQREERAEKARRLFTKELAARERRYPLEEPSKRWRPHQRSGSRRAALSGPTFGPPMRLSGRYLSWQFAQVSVSLSLRSFTASTFESLPRCRSPFPSFGALERHCTKSAWPSGYRFAVGTDPPGKKDQCGDFCERDTRIFDAFPTLILAEVGPVRVGLRWRDRCPERRR